MIAATSVRLTPARLFLRQPGVDNLIQPPKDIRDNYDYVLAPPFDTEISNALCKRGISKFLIDWLNTNANDLKLDFQFTDNPEEYEYRVGALCVRNKFYRLVVVIQEKVAQTSPPRIPSFTIPIIISKAAGQIIGVIGANAFYNELTGLLQKKTVGNQKFEIKSFTSEEAVSGFCHIIFIPAENSSMLPDVLKKMKGKSTLIVTEKSGLAKQGSGINFVVDNNKQRFELNKANIEKYDLKVSSTLASLAIPVE